MWDTIITWTLLLFRYVIAPMLEAIDLDRGNGSLRFNDIIIF